MYANKIIINLFFNFINYLQFYCLLLEINKKIVLLQVLNNNNIIK